MNIEYGVEMPAENADLEKIGNLSQEATWIDDELFELIDTEISATNVASISSSGWSEVIKERLRKTDSKLWSNDIPRCGPDKLLAPDFDDDDVLNDFVLLNLEIGKTSRTELAKAFKQLRVYEIFCEWIEVHEDINFGKLTKLIHDSLLDDPTPWRSDVKEKMTKRYFDWISLLSNEYEIIQHRVTKSIRKR